MNDFYQIKFKDYNLEYELACVKALINRRLQDLRLGVCYNGQTIADIYSADQNLMPPIERVLLALGLLSQLIPDYFSIFYNIKDEPFGRKAGGKIVNNVVYPTLQTFVFLMEGSIYVDIKNRCELLSVFENKSEIYRLISLEQSDDRDNLLDRRFYIRKEILSLLISGKPYSPDFDPDFPAQIIHTKMSWDDLVLPYQTFEDLEEIVNWVTYGNDVLSELKLGRKLKRGYRALFYGPSGTGKTLTASLIGKKVGMPVYRIDSAQITSKYIGETEKNLDRIFEYAEDKNWILFFDEAESLFSKRTTTKSSNDRYSNQQVGYLLQRIEDFPGVIVLSSNKKGEMDQAFLRRFQMMLEFKIPTVHERLILWRKGLTEDFEPDESVDLESIAQNYEITGGILINILRNLGVKAIKNKNRKIYHKDLLTAIEREFNKMGKTFN